MAVEANDFARVDPKVSLFRFLDFTKYVSMLDQRALFFTRSDQLADPFEGSSARSVARSNAACGEEEKTLRESVFMSCWHAKNTSRRRCGESI